MDKTRLLDGLAAGAWLTLALMRLNAGGLLNLLLAIQCGLAGGWLVFRRRAQPAGRLELSLLAWLSALAPLAMRPGASAFLPVILQSTGLALACWALWSLGPAFGIAPADRGLMVRGPYRWLRHPAYLGELIHFSGVLWSAPTLWNGLVLAAVAASLLVRLRAEERVIDGYAFYATRVRWRLVPGLW